MTQRFFMTNYYYRKDDTRCHNREECPEGSLIPQDERSQGPGNLPICETCIELGNAESRRNPSNSFMRDRT